MCYDVGFRFWCYVYMLVERNQHCLFNCLLMMNDYMRQYNGYMLMFMDKMKTLGYDLLFSMRKFHVCMLLIELSV